jgi:hypothetical protein
MPSIVWPIVARAQQPKRIVRIGILSGLRRPSETNLREALARLGYIEGQNTIFESRDAQGQMDRLGRHPGGGRCIANAN